MVVAWLQFYHKGDHRTIRHFSAKTRDPLGNIDDPLLNPLNCVAYRVMTPVHLLEESSFGLLLLSLTPKT